MKITIRQPLAFSEFGRKDNQEDALYPQPATVGTQQRVFLMCDGMGGHEHGEVASQTVAEAMGQTLDQSPDPRADFDSALATAYDALDAKDTDDGGKKMGTTMTCLILDEQGAFVAHIGDSRVYQIRPAMGLMLQTSDHSLVNDLLKAGELTEEEAQNYPHKNIITRAMQPHQERRSKAEIDLQDDIQAGDYFFLCCDGVLEQLTNQRLCEILALPIPDKDKLALIKAECDGKTRDNYTCWLVPIDAVEKTVGDEQQGDGSDGLHVLPVTDGEDEPQLAPPPVAADTSILAFITRYKWLIGGIVVVIVAMFIGIVFILKIFMSSPDAGDGKKNLPDSTPPIEVGDKWSSLHHNKPNKSNVDKGDSLTNSLLELNNSQTDSIPSSPSDDRDM